MKRFRIRDWENRILFKANTTLECYTFLKQQPASAVICTIDDLVEDTEIDSDTFIEAFDGGELPEDLSFF